MDRRSLLSMGLRPTAMILKCSGSIFLDIRLPRAGKSFRLARSPEPPKMTIRHSSVQRPLLLKKLDVLRVFSSKVIVMGQSRFGFLQIYNFSGGFRTTGKNRSMDASGFVKALQAAWERRADLRKRTTAYRLLNGAASG